MKLDPVMIASVLVAIAVGAGSYMRTPGLGEYPDIVVGQRFDCSLIIDGVAQCDPIPDVVPGGSFDCLVSDMFCTWKSGAEIARANRMADAPTAVGSISR